MTSNQDIGHDVDAGSSYGARDSQQLRLAGTNVRSKATRQSPGNDPYNTSGSFDRTKNWERVGKR